MIQVKCKNFLITGILLSLFVIHYCSPVTDRQKNENNRTENQEDISKAVPELRLITLEWEPFTGPKLKNDGFIVEIALESFRSAGYTTIDVSFFPWSRCLEMGKKGDIDAVVAAWHNEERAKDFYYSEPLIVNLKMFFKRKNSAVISTYSTLRDLEPYTIGIVRGYTYSEEFDSADYLKKDESDDVKMMFRKFFHERTDIVAASYYPALYVLEHELRLFKDDVEKIEPPLKKDPLYVIFPKENKNSRRLRDDFNKGLKILKENGRFQDILNKHNF